jgi:hypothetical protein
MNPSTSITAIVTPHGLKSGKNAKKLAVAYKAQRVSVTIVESSGASLLRYR